MYIDIRHRTYMLPADWAQSTAAPPRAPETFIFFSQLSAQEHKRVHNTFSRYKNQGVILFTGDRNQEITVSCLTSVYNSTLASIVASFLMPPPPAAVPHRTALAPVQQSQQQRV